MSGKLRILITGFGAFPGAPFNPTERLVERLVRLRRPGLAEVDLTGHIFHVSYAAVDRDLPALLAAGKPDALLMFGLAQRTPYVRIETRARNTMTTLWPDAAHRRIGATRIARHEAGSRAFGPHTTQLLRAARDSGVWAELSHDAGRYLCNYLSWKAIEATAPDGGPMLAGPKLAAPKLAAPRLAAFVHVPAVPRGTVTRRRSDARHVGFEELVDAGEAMLMTLVRLARQRARALPPG